MGIAKGYGYPALDVAFNQLFDQPTEAEKNLREIQRKIIELKMKADCDKLTQERKDRELLYKIAEKLGIDTK